MMWNHAVSGGQSRCHRRRGASAVEMALVLPVFLVVILGIIEFGRAMMVSNLITNAARQAGRMSTLEGTTNAEVTAYINNFLSQSVGATGASASTTISISPADGNADPENEIGNAGSGDLITIKVQVPFNDVALIPGSYLAGRNLTATIMMQHE